MIAAADSWDVQFVPIDISQLRELLNAIAQTELSEVILKSDDFELTVRKGITTLPSVTSVGEITATPTVVVSKPTANNLVPEVSTPPPVDSKLLEITSPMVGTFYRAPAPDEPPFVAVGDRISNGQAVCIIEAMKLMNEIEAEVSGQVVEILVENAQPVEYGQTLMRVKPD